MSARIVDSGHYTQNFSSGKNKITIQLPACDYIELTSAWVKIPYTATTVTSENSQLTSDVMYMCPTKTILVAGGSSSRFLFRQHYSRDSSDYLSSVEVTLNSDYTLTSAEFTLTQYYDYDFDWYYTCYKYN